VLGEKMAENKDNSFEKPQKEVVITAEDCRAALDFWNHFNIPIPEALQSAIDSFALSPSIETQDKVKLEVCRAISETDHEAFKDEMFSKIVEECSAVTFDMQFDQDVDNTFSE
jgi:hypothetical protein